MTVRGNYRVVYKTGYKTPWTAKWHAQHVATAPVNKGKVLKIEKKPIKKRVVRRGYAGIVLPKWSY